MTSVDEAEDDPRPLAAERAVLGRMLLSPVAVTTVATILTPEHFTHPAHRDVFETILALADRGAPTSEIAVVAALAGPGLVRVGGPLGVHALVEDVMSTADVGYYADLVRDRARRAEAVEALNQAARIVVEGDATQTAENFERVRNLVEQVTEDRGADVDVDGAWVHETIAEEVSAWEEPAEAGLMTGYTDFDELVGGLTGGQFIIIAGRPGQGKSTVGFDWARYVAEHGAAVLAFSLEMSRREVMQRLISAKAKVRLRDIRQRTWTEYEHGLMTQKAQDLRSVALRIEDGGEVSLPQIRARARAMKRSSTGLDFLLVDYLQLLSSGKKVESRQQEVSEFSRGLKLLAKELHIPVIGVSQLNRGPEQRTDKRPILSDLRESGCMTRETTLLRADTGAPISFGALIDGDMRDVPVWSLDGDGRMVAAPLAKAFPSGHKHAYRMRLASGRVVEASGNHKFRTLNDWRPLDQLAVGDRLAVPRRVPDPLEVGLGWTEHRMALLAYLIADGTVLAHQSVHITDDDLTVLETARAAAAAEFGITARIIEKGQDASRCASIYLPAPFQLTHGRHNPIGDWFRSLGIFDLRSKQKRLPDALYRASRTEIAWFLKHYLSTDGSVSPKRGRTAPTIRFDTSSRQIADGLVQLLGRLGIVPRLQSIQTWYAVSIGGAADMRWFAENVGAVGRARDRLDALLQSLPTTSNTNVDTLPLTVWGRVQEARRAAGMTERQLQAAIGMSYCGSTLYKSCPSRERLTRIATALGSSELRALAETDIFWDRVVSIEPLGLREVFDATVKGTHNFVAEGIVAHNSLEQDADLVILLNRPDAWERDDPRAGEADLIIAKHRNGPTATITVAHQLHYSRFTDLARGPQ